MDEDSLTEADAYSLYNTFIMDQLVEAIRDLIVALEAFCYSETVEAT